MKSLFVTAISLCLLALPTHAQVTEPVDDPAERLRLSSIMMRGAEATKDLKISLAPLKEFGRDGVLLTPDGIIAPTPNGELLCRLVEYLGCFERG